MTVSFPGAYVFKQVMLTDVRRPHAARNIDSRACSRALVPSVSSVAFRGQVCAMRRRKTSRRMAAGSLIISGQGKTAGILTLQARANEFRVCRGSSMLPAEERGLMTSDAMTCGTRLPVTWSWQG
jgi:hypothetical protein